MGFPVLGVPIFLFSDGAYGVGCTMDDRMVVSCVS